MTKPRQALRRTLRVALRKIEPLSARAGSKALSNPGARRVFNSVYEHSGLMLADLVTRLVASAPITSPFVWKARLPTGELLIPVLPELHRSWSNALVWRWPPNLPTRQFYGEYTAYRQAGAQDRITGGRDLLLDVGANDGMHSCFFALAGWDCVAFEPQPSCVDYVRQISNLNNFESVVVQQCAVGEKDLPDVEFFASESTWFSSLDRESVEQFEPASILRVEMITLDAYCQPRNLVPTCVKIDVEGRELAVVRGGQRLIEAVRPDLVIEVSADPANRMAIWEQLAPFGYSAFVLPTHPRGSPRPLPDVETFVGVSSGEPHIDAVFTADGELKARLEKLAH